jgi:hypothetical protein
MARYAPDVDNLVHILDTPMQAYLTLGATLQGFHSKVEYVRTNYDLRGRLYADSRTFMRLGSDQADASLTRLLNQPARIVSPVSEGITVLEFSSEGNASWANRTKVLDRLFGGNEYRLYDCSNRKEKWAPDHRPFVILADHPFTVPLKGESVTAKLDPTFSLFYLKGFAEHPSSYGELAAQSGQLTLAVQVLPQWMSVNAR